MLLDDLQTDRLREKGKSIRLAFFYIVRLKDILAAEAAFFRADVYLNETGK